MTAWRRLRLKYLAAVPIVNGVGEPGEFEDPDWPRYIRTTDIANSRRLRDDVFKSLPPDVAARAPVRRGDLLMVAAGATIGKSYLHSSDRPACFAGYLVRFRARQDVDSRFVAYWTESGSYWQQVESQHVKATIENFSAARYRNLSIDVPPLTKQRAIADFLDRETARIDRLVLRRLRLAELVQERHQRLTDELFSRMGRSKTKLKHLLLAPPCYGVLVPSFVDSGGTRLVRVGDLAALAERCETLPRISNEQSSKYGRTVVRAGDILLSVVGSLDKVAIVDERAAGCNVSRAVARLQPKPNVSRLLLKAWFTTSDYQRQLAAMPRSPTAQPVINMGELANFILRYPGRQDEVDEATARYRFLEEQMGTVSQALSHQLQLLAERRAALITGAVSGRIDIARTLN